MAMTRNNREGLVPPQQEMPENGAPTPLNGPENLGPTTEPSLYPSKPDDLVQGIEHGSDKRRFPTKIVAAGVSLLAVGALAVGMMKNNGSEVKAPQGVETGATGEPGSDEVASSDDSNTAETQEEPRSEDIIRDGRAIVPASDNPQQLAEMLMSNRDCYLNTGDEKCLNYYVLNPHASSGSLVPGLMASREEIIDFRKAHPKYSEKSTPTVTEFDFSDPSMRTISYEVLAEITDGVNGDAKFAHRGRFVLKARDVLHQDGFVKAWVVAEVENSNPVQLLAE